MRGMVRKMLPILALGMAGLLGGCVVYPAYPSYGYGYHAPYYGGGYVAAGGGGWHHEGWRHD